LAGDAGENLRDGLIDGVQCHVAADTWVDIDIEPGVPGQNKQQVLDWQIVGNDAEGFALDRRAGWWRTEGLANGSRDDLCLAARLSPASFATQVTAWRCRTWLRCAGSQKQRRQQKPGGYFHVSAAVAKTCLCYFHN